MRWDCALGIQVSVHSLEEHHDIKMYQLGLMATMQER
jgi:hypothetical protein